MGPAPAKLVVRFGPYPNQEYSLPEHTITLGREPINDIVINDPEISRRHSRVTVTGGRYFLEDLGSTNGTFVNGRRLAAPTPLNHGDIIDLGESISFAFHSQTEVYDPTMIEGEPVQFGQAAATQYESPVPYSAEPVPWAMLQAAGNEPEYTERITGPIPPAPARQSNSLRILAGCGCLLLLTIFLCAATFFVLDSYNNGILLYCGPLRPLWEAILTAGRVAQQCATA